MFKIHKEELDVNGKKLTLETGKVARQADGAIIATMGETVVIATAVAITTVSPQVAIIAPSACLAILPVSKIIFFPLISISSLQILNITSLNLIV